MEEMLRTWFLYIQNMFRAPPTDEELRESLSELSKTTRPSTGPDHNFDEPFSASSGMCLVIFPGGKRQPFCADNVENATCQAFARANGGIARKVIPGSKCPM